MTGQATTNPAVEYWVDALQRSVLFMDLLRQRGNISREHNEAVVPNVLEFDADLVLDGRTLPRPVNYLLVRIRPPEGTSVDDAKRPFIVVDPRAGHGPGIGGMKQDSEIGVALEAGHPCYFVGFLPEPMPDQTIEDVWTAEAAFVQAVSARHPKAESKPAIIANCQAGWQTMIMAATQPDVPGPILLAGSPLSYWSGVRGKNPLRYTGGVLGGTWLTAMSGDMGAGLFDGANLVANFESLNPANTWWEKPYNVYSKVDTEGPRFLDFETWWGSPVLLNAGEMQWIADELFVGNKLSSGKLKTSDGVRVDLRNIKSPIIVFCSWGDDITPPQQALGWITDLYATDDELISNGQTIVYTLHQSIGHLGIFVSGKVASKEHQEFTTCMDMIDLMPPGLYEAVITEVDANTENAALVEGEHLLRLEPRSLDDIRAFGGNPPEDDLRFATAARVSEVNKELYRTLVAPAVQAAASEPSAEALRQAHPNRLRFAMFSDQNPLMAPLGPLAEAVREQRAPVSPDNPFLAMEQMMASWISSSLEAYKTARDDMTEKLFLNAYGSPVLQAMVGLTQEDATTGPRIERDVAREAEIARLLAELSARFEEGDLRDAVLRALAYVNVAEGGADERTFSLLKAYHAAQPAKQRGTLAELKADMKEQYLLVRLDADRAMDAIPKLLPPDPAARHAALEALHRAIAARGALTDEGRRRLARIDALFA